MWTHRLPALTSMERGSSPKHTVVSAPSEALYRHKNSHLPQTPYIQCMATAHLDAQDEPCRAPSRSWETVEGKFSGKPPLLGSCPESTPPLSILSPWISLVANSVRRRCKPRVVLSSVQKSTGCGGNTPCKASCPLSCSSNNLAYCKHWVPGCRNEAPVRSRQGARRDRRLNDQCTDVADLPSLLPRHNKPCMPNLSCCPQDYTAGESFDEK